MRPSKREALRSRDGQTLCRVIRALLRTRAEAVLPRTAPFTFPLTEEAFVRVARRAGITVGQKQARRLIALAISTGLIVRLGHYTSKKWRYNVPLYRLGCRFTRVRGGDLRLRQEHTPVGSYEVVKVRVCRRGVAWWLDPLMGMPDGKPPPETEGRSARARRLRRWRPRSEAVVGCP
jgi:hypothetical protein